MSLPVVISFTVETDGRLPSGQTLGDAIAQIDAATTTSPAYYMVNCAHPTHFVDHLDPTADWVGRIRGVRANASTLSHAELDDATELDRGDIGELADGYAQLATGARPAGGRRLLRHRPRARRHRLRPPRRQPGRVTRQRDRYRNGRPVGDAVAMSSHDETPPGRIVRLVGVYDADSTLRGELSYWVGARLGRRHCSLCEITHGSVRQRPEWKACRADLPVPFDTYHRNDQPDSIRAVADGQAPVVVAQTDAGHVVILTSDDLETCDGSIDLLVEAIENSAERLGLGWGTP